MADPPGLRLRCGVCFSEEASARVRLGSIGLALGSGLRYHCEEEDDSSRE